MTLHNYVHHPLQFDLTGSSCPTFSYNEHLQIYNHMEEAYHSQHVLYSLLFELSEFAHC